MAHESDECPDCREQKRIHDRVNDALAQIYPLMSQWALVVEHADPASGSPRLHTLISESGTIWAQAGMVGMLGDYVDDVASYQPDDD